MEYSPKANAHNIRHSSNPIEIPRRRRPIVPWSASPSARPESPELIFEMSPVSPGFPSPSRHISQNFDTQEPFMYSFPKFSAHRNYTYSGRRVTTFHNTAFPVAGSPLAPSPSSAIPKHSPSLPCAEIDDDTDSLSPALTYSTTLTKSASTTKITGFTPISTQPHTPVQPLKTKRLSPPPRTSSYSSSPWILPGKSDAHDMESGSLEVDPTYFEFDRHLMRRIENQNPRRFRRVSLISSIL